MVGSYASSGDSSFQTDPTSESPRQFIQTGSLDTSLTTLRPGSLQRSLAFAWLVTTQEQFSYASQAKVGWGRQGLPWTLSYDQMGIVGIRQNVCYKGPTRRL